MNKLQKKLGPLPVWAWIAAAVFVLALAWYIRHRASQTPVSSAVADPGPAPAPEAVGLTGGGVGNLGGGTGSIGNGTGTFDPNALEFDTSAIQDAFQTQLDSIAANIAAHVPPPSAPAFPVPVVPSPSAPPIYESPTAPVVQAPVALATPPSPVAVAPPPPAPSVQTTFSWGGQTWGRGDKQRFISWLNAHGASYPLWVIRHPKAAHDVFGEPI